ncbi:Ger(x)C family spore germination protein [Gracilibacillus dipsosauri]|uniref:Ger(x)C family spore germination protein n=1 Tax=Gracilibacillus dipsosauri TaxID=178340 RepID=UPI00240A7C59
MVVEIYRIKFVFVLISFVFLAACMQTKIIEQHAIINTYGIDISEESENLIETVILSYIFDEQAENVTTINYGKGKTIKEANQNAEKKSSFTFLPGQIRLVLYGKETAEKGFKNYLNVLIRDARLSDMMYLAVSETTAKDILLLGQENADIDMGQYMEKLIEKEIKGDSIPNVSLHKLTHTYEDPGKDPIMPLISLTDNKIAITGMALFQNDKYVGKISMEDAFLVNLFQNKVHDRQIHLSISREPFLKYLSAPQANRDQLHLSFLIIDGESKTRLTDIKELSYQTDVNLKVILNETSETFKDENEQFANLLEKEVEEEVKRQYKKLLATLQNANSDPLGLGSIYRAHKKNGKLTAKEWHQKFPEITINFNVDVKLINTGIKQ